MCVKERVEERNRMNMCVYVQIHNNNDDDDDELNVRIKHTNRAENSA